ncbi:hypothetical protein [Rickettsiales endosymbiont of Stachyamoeba lipophora]|uniref:hypothetical protein n=1 Tax=Rickettsiales endosymbiont of Stachyamoeba lipophora TaxID=2486578 RepID=UPI000F64577E|nr:hypothetical protein [Rickettsiales endosymbiont of Stachyamoeba lipophora]AZL15071.1 hypothetical protein EF513_00640 [Rickettsiales endosymbiont of Stachyamoeba lipophora]
MQLLYPLGETDKSNFAYLYDRVALSFPELELKQKYGTQVILENGKCCLQDYEGSLQDVDYNRSEMGLENVEEYIKSLEEIYL